LRIITQLRACSYVSDFAHISCVVQISQGAYPHAAIRTIFHLVVLQEADLPADRPYVFGYHPHGTYSLLSFMRHITESTGIIGMYVPAGFLAFLNSLHIGAHWRPSPQKVQSNVSLLDAPELSPPQRLASLQPFPASNRTSLRSRAISKYRCIAMSYSRSGYVA
jgi:hypothetical protein